MSVITTTITPFTRTPSRQNPSTFSEDMDIRLSEENSRITQMNNLGDEMNDVADLVNTIEANLDLVANDLTNIDTVASNISSVNTVSTNIAKVSNLDTNMTKITNLDTNMSKISNVDNNMSKVSNLDTNMTSITTVDTNMTDVISVADNEANINILAAEAQDGTLALKANINSPALTGTPTVNGVAFSGYSGFKNYIINGRFKVNQYGKLPYVAQAGSAVFIDGNWRCANSGTGTLTLSEDTITYENTVYTAIKATATTAITLGTDTRYFACTQPLEANNISEVSNKDMTLSFLFECSRAGKYSVSLNKLDSATGVVQKSYLTSFNATIGVQQVVIPIPAESYQVLKSVNSGMFFHIGSVFNSATVISSNDGWQDGAKYMKSDALQWGDTAGAYIKYAQVQLEEGSVATPFEQRPYGLELSLCQRYYEEQSIMSSYGSAPYITICANYKVKKRTYPTTVVIDAIGNIDRVSAMFTSGAGQVNGIVLAASSVTSDYFRATISGNSGQYGGAIFTVKASAEL